MLIVLKFISHLPGEWVYEEGDDGGGGERAGEVDAGQYVEAGTGGERLNGMIGLSTNGRTFCIIPLQSFVMFCFGSSPALLGQ